MPHRTPQQLPQIIPPINMRKVNFVYYATVFFQTLGAVFFTTSTLLSNLGKPSFLPKETHPRLNSLLDFQVNFGALIGCLFLFIAWQFMQINHRLRLKIEATIRQQAASTGNLPHKTAHVAFQAKPKKNGSKTDSQEQENVHTA